MRNKNPYTMFVLLLAGLLIWPIFTVAAELPGRAGEIKKGITAEASCAIVGMSAEQSQLTALQRARAAAIEQAAGVSITSATLVTNYTVAADFIKSYSRGFIVAEKVIWLPLGQYQKNKSTPPIPEYHVKIEADVYIPLRKEKAIGLKANLNNAVFRTGEKARVTIKTKSVAKVALFNIMVDDTVALLFPNTYEPDNKLEGGKEFIFPAKDAKVEIEMQTLPGHKKDAEAMFVVAWDAGREIDILRHFTPGEAIPISEFFSRLSEIIDQCEDAILPYEVVAK